MGFFSGKKLLLLGSIVVLLAAIPLTVYFITQQQEIRSRATPATVLSLCDPTKTTSCESSVSAETGKTVSLDVIMDPGSNQVSFIKLHITYDPTKLELSSGGLVPNTTVVTTLKDPVYSSGSVVVSLGIVVNPTVGVDVTKSIASPTKIATITFKALAPTTTANQVVFGNQVVVYANNETGDPNAPYPANLNVLSTTKPALVTITGAATATPTPTPAGSAPVANQPPVCTALNVDRATSGTAPYSITFTVNGNDPNGTISKVTFDFGDGQVQNVTQNGGVGTNSVSTQMAHTYNNPATYTATASLTDNANAVSVQSVACTKTITVTAANIGIGTSNPIVVIAAVPTSTPTPTALPAKKFTEAPGPSNAILGIGALGTILTIIGGILFLSL